jgi:hypothetical protein
MPKSNPSRRLLLPYTVILLVINTAFAITQNVLMEEETIEGPFGAWKQGGCSPLLMLRSVFVAFPIFLNDFLFVSAPWNAPSYTLKRDFSCTAQPS